MYKYSVNIAGYAPAHSKEANAFLAACDLGIDGAYVPQMETISFSSKTPKSETDFCEKLKAKMVDAGWKDVYIWGWQETK